MAKADGLSDAAIENFRGKKKFKTKLRFFGQAAVAMCVRVVTMLCNSGVLDDECTPGNSLGLRISFPGFGNNVPPTCIHTSTAGVCRSCASETHQSSTSQLHDLKRLLEKSTIDSENTR